MPQFSEEQNGKFVVFIVGPMGGDKDSPGGRKSSVRDWILRRRRRPSTPVSQHTRNIAEAARQILQERGIQESQYEVYVPEEILDSEIVSSVFHKIDTADLAIADISNRSANVFYEVAYFNALGTPLIILDESGADLPFYWRQMRVSNLRDFSVEAVKAALAPRFEAYFTGTGIDLSSNPITSFYDAPLVDISASSGVAVGFFENFAFHLLVNGGVLASNPNLDDLLIIRPSRINNFSRDSKRAENILARARDKTLEARTHPRGAVRVKILGQSIIDFPTPLYALVRAPRYKRLRRRLQSMGMSQDAIEEATARMEGKLIEAYFRTLKFLIDNESNVAKDSVRIVNLDDFERGTA